MNGSEAVLRCSKTRPLARSLILTSSVTLSNMEAGKILEITLKDLASLKCRREDVIMENQVKASGGYSDVFVGVLMQSRRRFSLKRSGQRIAIKRLRVLMHNDVQFARVS